MTKYGVTLPLVDAVTDYTPTTTKTWFDTGLIRELTVGTFIDPKTLKPCAHKWVPDIEEMADGWQIKPECRKCGITGSPSDKGVSLAKLVRQLGR